MKRMLVLINILLVIYLAPAKSEESDFRVGFFDLDFHTVNDDGSEGNAIKYFQLILKEMNTPNVKFYKFPLPRLIKMLEEDRIDMILFMGKNDERAKKFTYSKIPLFYMQPCLVLRKNKIKHDINGVDDILDLKIGTYQDGLYIDWLLDPRVNIQSITGENIVKRSLNKVLAGRIDAFYSPDRASVSYVITKSFPSEQLELISLPVPRYGAYSAFSKKSSIKYKETYESALMKVQHDHPYTMPL